MCPQLPAQRRVLNEGQAPALPKEEDGPVWNKLFGRKTLEYTQHRPLRSRAPEFQGGVCSPESSPGAHACPLPTRSQGTLEPQERERERQHLPCRQQRAASSILHQACGFN